MAIQDGCLVILESAHSSSILFTLLCSPLAFLFSLFSCLLSARHGSGPNLRDGQYERSTRLDPTLCTTCRWTTQSMQNIAKTCVRDNPTGTFYLFLYFVDGTFFAGNRLAFSELPMSLAFYFWLFLLPGSFPSTLQGLNVSQQQTFCIFAFVFLST